MKPFKQILKQLQIAFRLLVKNDPMRLAGATAFFTTFALPPILIILIQLLSLVFDERTISRQLFEHLGDIIGRDSVMQLIRTLRAFRDLADTLPLTIGGFIFLLFVATLHVCIFQKKALSFLQIMSLKKGSRQKLSQGLI
jgi:membrane protein